MLLPCFVVSQLPQPLILLQTAPGLWLGVYRTDVPCLAGSDRAHAMLKKARHCLAYAFSS